MSTRALSAFWLLAIILGTDARALSVIPVSVSLKGLHSVHVSVRNLSGWTEVDDALAVVEPQVVRRLREAGLRLVSEDEWESDMSTPNLDIAVRGAKVRSTTSAPEICLGPASGCSDASTAFVFHVAIQLVQQVRLVRDGHVTFDGRTWSWDWPIESDRKRPFKTLRENVFRGVDDFIAAWRRAQTDS